MAEGCQAKIFGLKQAQMEPGCAHLTCWGKETNTNHQYTQATAALWNKGVTFNWLHIRSYFPSVLSHPLGQPVYFAEPADKLIADSNLKGAGMGQVSTKVRENCMGKSKACASSDAVTC